MAGRIRIYAPPAAAVDWAMFASDVKLHGRVTKPIHLKETFDLGSQSTVMAVWQGRPVGVIPMLRICKQLKLNPTKYLMER